MCAFQSDRSIVLEEQRSIIGNTNLLRVEIVSKNHPFYQQGRNLSELMYRKIWQTENLIDDNDYAIVVFARDWVIASVNVQLKRPHILLKSEKFFHPLHWQNYLSVAESEIAEISGLAIEDRLPSSLSRPVLMAMILGLRMLLTSLDLKVYTTIQHKFLIRVLTKSLKLPFFINSTRPGNNVPDDNYWKREEPPRIYYLEGRVTGLNSEVSAACNSFWHYFEKANLKVLFTSRITGEIPDFYREIA
jgi:hypothetical protein